MPSVATAVARAEPAFSSPICPPSPGLASFSGNLSPAHARPGRPDIAWRSSDTFFAFGVRGVGGLLFDFKNVPLDAFVEVAGVLEYGCADGEGAGFALNAGAGIRYYF